LNSPKDSSTNTWRWYYPKTCLLFWYWFK